MFKKEGSQVGWFALLCAGICIGVFALAMAKASGMASEEERRLYGEDWDYEDLGEKV